MLTPRHARRLRRLRAAPPPKCWLALAGLVGGCGGQSSREEPPVKDPGSGSSGGEQASGGQAGGGQAGAAPAEAGEGQGEPDPPPVGSETAAPPSQAPQCPPDDELILDGDLGPATNIFRVFCVQCHGTQQAAEFPTALPRFDSLGDAVARELLDPCVPGDSPLVTSFRSGTMPPPSALQPVRPDLEALERGIPILCGATPNAFLCKQAPLYPGCVRTNAEEVLTKRCGACHDGSSAAGIDLFGAAAAGDVDALIEGGAIVPCDPEGSPLLAALRAGPLPTHDACTRFPDTYEVGHVEAFVNDGCE